MRDFWPRTRPHQKPLYADAVENLVQIRDAATPGLYFYTITFYNLMIWDLAIWTKINSEIVGT